jgi:hypothetical protein
LRQESDRPQLGLRVSPPPSLRDSIDDIQLSII